jgi:ribosomal protein S11
MGGGITLKKLFTFFTACFLIAGTVSLTVHGAENEYAIVISNGGITVNGGDISGGTGAVTAAKVTEAHENVAETLKDVENTVISINSAGTYRVSGKRDDCQILVNAGASDTVRLILDNADISCRTAPAILIHSAYDPQKAGESGVVIELAEDGSNNISGAPGADNSGAISSDISFTIEGSGVLNLTSSNEGIETQKHLTINGGDITIKSADDAINASEDGVSQITVNGGYVFASASLGSEGDGIDSNGGIAINGGTVISMGHPSSQDGGIDADLGVIVNGGTAVGIGNMQSELSPQSSQQYMALTFAAPRTKDTLVTVTDKEGNVITAFKSPQTFRSIALSVPGLEDGAYNVFVGGDIAGTVKNGLYTDVTSFKNGVKQQYSNTSAGRGMWFPGEIGEPPEGIGPRFEPSERPAPGNLPGDMNDLPEMGRMPENMRERPKTEQPPEGMGMGERPERNGIPPEGMDMPPGNMGVAEGAGLDFILNAETHAFNGIQAAADQ